MATATIESTFLLLDRASGPIRSIRREVRGLERDARKAGLALDGMGGPRFARDIDRMANETQGLRTQMRGLPADTRHADRAMADLDRTVTRAGRNTQKTSTYFSMLTDRTKLLTVAAGAALPAIQAVGGAAVALAGSLYGAGIGAGAVGLAGGGALGAGLLSVVAVAKPAQQALKDTWKQQDVLTKAVTEHGKTSKQARLEQERLDRLYRGQPGLKHATTQMRALNKEWREATAPGRRQYYGLLGDIAQIGQRAAPRMAANANLAMGGVRKAGVAQARFLAGNFAQDTFAGLVHEFTRDLPIAERSLENVEVVLGRIATAATPFFHEGVLWVEATTKGWRDQTKDAAGLRHEIGGFVDDLKAWGHLTESAFKLAHDVLMGGRPAGRNMVEDFTKTLDRWDSWVERNPEKIDSFFRNAVSDTEDIAKSVGQIVTGLNNMATELRPLLAPLERLVSLFASLSGSLSPGAAATLLLGVRGLRNSIAGGGGAAVAGGAAATAAGGGGGFMPMVFGGAAATRGASLRARASSQFRMGSQGGFIAGPAGIEVVEGRGLAGGLSRVGGRVLAPGALRVGGAVGRFALPAIAIGGLQGAFGGEGSNQGQGFFGHAAFGIRNAAQGAAATFGLANPVLGTNERINRGMARAQQFVGGLPGALTPTARQARQAAGDLRPELARAEQAAANAIDDNNRYEEALAYLKALREQARAYRDIARDAKHAGEVEANQRSREHATSLIDSFGKSFDTRSKRVGPAKALDHTLGEVYDKMRGMRRTGAKILGENVLSWAHEMARKNPALQGEVDDFTKRVEHGFSKMGDHVRVVNGQILTGSQRQWQAIGAAIVDPANRALSQTSAAFSAMREQAVAQLELMGYSHRDALAVFRGVRSGKFSVAQAGQTTGAGQPALQSQANKARDRGGFKSPLGDGTGDGRGDRMTLARSQTSTGGSASLMGANPNLAPYDSIAHRFGLGVTSGLRPGAITASGNVSLHASGHAIDESGPAAGMLSYARYMASHYGPGLEELIHTPLGFGIKNGQRVPLSFWGSTINSEHFNHVHVGDVDPAGGGSGAVSFPFSPDTAGPGMLNLKVPNSGLGGVPGAMANAAMSAYAAGIMQKVNGMGPGGGGKTSAGGRFDKAALEALWVQAGGPANVAPIMAAIALAESGGNPGIGNAGRTPNGTTVAAGLWQILGLPFPGDPTDPLTNARMAVAKYQAGGLHPWDASRAQWGRRMTFMGDGLGVSRQRLSGGAFRASGGVSVGGRGTIVHFRPNINVNGSDRASLRHELGQHFERFADMIVEEITSGSEADAGALIG